MENNHQDIDYEKIEKDWEIDNEKFSAQHKSGLVFHYLQTREDGSIELATEDLSKWKQEQAGAKNEQEVEEQYQKLKKEFSQIVKSFSPVAKVKPSVFFNKVMEKYRQPSK